MATLTVLMGPPGAGKTTWLQRNASAGWVVCSTERLRTDRSLNSRAVVAFLASLRTRAAQALASGLDVVVDGCNTRRAERSAWLGLAHSHYAHTHLVVLHASLDTVLRVQQGRAHPVPAEKVRSYWTQWRQSLRSLPSEGWGRVTHVHRDSDAATDVDVALPRCWIAEEAP